MDIENVKKKFYELRRQKGLSWADLAAAAGVNDYHKIANLLNSPGMTLATLQRLAALVSVEPWELLKPETTKPKNTANIICPHCNKLLYIAIARKETEAQTQATEAKETERTNEAEPEQTE